MLNKLKNLDLYRKKAKYMRNHPAAIPVAFMRFRDKHRLTQAWVGSRIKVDSSLVSHYEHGSRIPSEPTLINFVKLKESLKNKTGI